MGFPIIFMVLIGLAFGRPGGQPLDVGLVDEDKSPTSALLIEALKKSPDLVITIYDSPSEAERQVKLGKEIAFIVIPQGFEEEVKKRMASGKGRISLIMGYDHTKVRFGVGPRSALESVASELFGFESPFFIEAKRIIPGVKRPIMNWVAPALIIFGLMILIPTAASTIVRHKQTGFLTRLATTPIKPFDFVLGYSLPFILVGLASVPLYLAIAIGLGMEIMGSLPLALLLYLLFVILCAGMGMIIGSLTKTFEQAIGLSWLLIIPLSIISGILLPTEGMPGYIKALANIFPFKYAADASRYLISRGGDFEVVSLEFLIIFAWMVFSFTLGIILFRRAITR